MVVYLAAITAVAVARLPGRGVAGWVLAINALILTLIVLVHDRRTGRFTAVLREIYPIVLLPALYGSIDLLNGPGVRTWDGTVQGWEQALFGAQLSRVWWQTAPSTFWSSVLHAAYFVYYLIIPFPVIYLLARRRPDAARRAVTLMVGTFLLCYLAFVLFPVAGPYYEFPRPSAAFLDNAPARLVYATLASGSSYGAAFPSSHVAATVSAVLGTWLASPRIGAVLVIPALLLTVGVVYCQMHYAVDAMAGLVVPLVVAALVGRSAKSAR